MWSFFAMPGVSRFSPPPTAKRISELDGLRGLAALAVVFFHYTSRYGELFGAPEGLWFDFPRGDFGVFLFFMLSGYVIFMTLDRTRSADEFVVARFARLYPTYWVALLATFVVVRMFHLPGQEVGFGALLVNLSMVQSLCGFPHVDGAYWSLQEEILFYVAMLALWRVGLLKNALRTLSVWLAIAVAVELGTWWLPEQIGGKLGAVQTFASLRFLHLFVIGMAIYRQQREPGNDPGWLLLVIACWFWHAILDSASGGALVAAFSIVIYLATTGHLPWLAARPLAYLGLISYPLYLIHQNVGYVIIRELNGAGWNANASLLAATATALGLAAILSRYVERPAHRAIKARYAAWKDSPRGAIRLPRRRVRAH
jgi:peptidoglycan/LPS O-acetylase OafA/YrhL